MAEEQNSTPRVPAYCSYRVFRQFVDWIADMETIPGQIDASVRGNRYSGATWSQLRGGAVYLGILDGETPTPRLRNLAQASDAERKELMRDALQNAYGDDLIDTLDSLTPKTLEARLRELGAPDSTVRKAASFLVQALSDAGVAVPQVLAKRPRGRSVTNKARKRKPAKRDLDASQPAEPIGGGAGASEDTQRIDLDSGGSVELRVGVNLIALTEQDREWLFSLVDHFRSYTARTTETEATSTARRLGQQRHAGRAE